MPINHQKMERFRPRSMFCTTCLPLPLPPPAHIRQCGGIRVEFIRSEITKFQNPREQQRDFPFRAKLVSVSVRLFLDLLLARQHMEYEAHICYRLQIILLLAAIVAISALCIVMTMAQSEHIVRMRLFRLNFCCFYSRSRKTKRKQNKFQLRFSERLIPFQEMASAIFWKQNCGTMDLHLKNGNKREIVSPLVRVLLQNAVESENDKRCGMEYKSFHYRQHLFSLFLSFSALKVCCRFFKTIHFRTIPVLSIDMNPFELSRARTKSFPLRRSAFIRWKWNCVIQLLNGKSNKGM